MPKAHRTSQFNVAAFAAQTWQPITTAPTNGTVLLVGWVQVRFPSLGFYHDHRGWISYVRDVVYVDPPTHWMPLPAPPAAEAP